MSARKSTSRKSSKSSRNRVHQRAPLVLEDQEQNREASPWQMDGCTKCSGAWRFLANGQVPKDKRIGGCAKVQCTERNSGRAADWLKSSASHPSFFIASGISPPSSSVVLPHREHIAAWILPASSASGRSKLCSVMVRISSTKTDHRPTPVDFQ